MSAPVLIGFAGVLVAAVATGMLAGLCARRLRIDLVVWTVAALGLTVALAAQSMGFAEGFGAATFLAVQLSALLLVPLWLSWGLVEATGNEAARFGMRLASGALTVVAGLIVATDPLTAQPFSKSWPLTGPHSQAVSGYALDAVQGVAVIVALLVVGLAAARARATLIAVGPIALAVLLTAGLRASLPAKSAYPLLSTMAAALIWFGVTRAQDLPGGDASRDLGDGREQAAGRDLGDGRERVAGRATEFGPGGWYGPDGEYSVDDRRLPRDAADPRGRGGPAGTSRVPGYRPPGADDVGGRRPAEQEWRRETAPPNQARPPGVQVAPSAWAPSAAPSVRTPSARAPSARAPATEGEAGPQAKADPAAKPYGRLLIFTLLEDRVADFDRLAEQTAEQVSTGEPDTLVYVIHLVPNAPLQRIFYEIYRDRGAFESHENQPYMRRFVADRRSCVLATNSIELRLKYAKVAPLPNAQPTGQPPPAGQLPPAGQAPPGTTPPAGIPAGVSRPPRVRTQPPPRPPQPMAPQPLAPLPDPRDRRPPDPQPDPRDRRPPPDPRDRRRPPADPRYGGI